MTEVNVKDFEKLSERMDKFEQKFLEQKISYDDQLERIHNELLEIKELFVINQKLVERDKGYEDRITNLKTEVTEMQTLLTRNQRDIEEHIKTQEEIIVSLINKFNDQALSKFNQFTAEIEELKNQQDVLRISYTVNEKKLIEKIKDTISSEIKNAVKEKEKEILMNLWIRDLREIISNFEKLKRMNPEEFNLKLNQIADIVDSFKKKLQA